MSEQPVREILQAAVPTAPDLTIFCNTLPQTAARRISERGSPDRFEAEGIELQKSVHQYYLNKTCKETRVHSINTDTLSAEEAAQMATRIIEQAFSAEYNPPRL